jgi:reverse gyrase
MYTQTIKLKDNELPAKINVETGEVKEVNHKKNNIPEGKSKLGYDNFSITNNKMAMILEKHCSNEELGIIYKMISKSEFNTNSLNPLTDDTSIRDLANEFNVGKNKVIKIFSKLFELGVYAQISIANDINYGKPYWILNPYISWKGNLINSDIKRHFISTKIVKELFL